MKKQANDITHLDQLFKKIPDDSALLHEDVEPMWNNAFETRVKTQNFLRFGWYHFNVYHLALIVGLLSLGAYYYVGVSSNEKVSSIKSTHPISINPSNDKGTSSPINTLSQKNKRSAATPHTRSISAENNDIDTLDNTSKYQLDVEPIQTAEPDPTLTTTPSSSTLQEQKTTPVKKKKVIYVVQQDTVQKIDTIRSKKEWRKAKRNK